MTGQCDDSYGSCTCQPGVTGHKCDSCVDGHWNYQRDGCEGRLRCGVSVYSGIILYC